MRNGHLYRMRAWLAEGVDMDEICHRFRNIYDAEEIESFLKPKKKRGRPRKADAEQSLDM